VNRHERLGLITMMTALFVILTRIFTVVESMADIDGNSSVAWMFIFVFYMVGVAAFLFGMNKDKNNE